MSQIAGHLSLPREELSEEWGGVFWGELFISPRPLSSSLLTGSGEGNGNPLQCSFPENPRDGGAWWAAVYGVAQSQTRLKRLSSSSSSSSSDWMT